MLYLDTNVIVNAFLPENPKFEISSKIFKEALSSNNLLCSSILIQEVCYVLSRHNVLPLSIQSTAHILLKHMSTRKNFQNHLDIVHNSISIATKVGFQNINDCVHLKEAEIMGCNELITFDKGFKKLLHLTTMKITILE